MDKLNEKMIYTEQESTWASQIAYCNITTDLINELIENKHIDEPTFADICDYCIEEGRVLWNDGKPNSEHEFLMNAKDMEYGSWKVVGVCDQNKENGLYAVAIETGEYTRNGVDNSVILAVRGSEVVGEQGFLDWMKTDANFINSDITEQEKALNEYVNTEFTDLVREKGYTYTAYMGHSLGGYLTFEAAANTAAVNPYLCRKYN